MLMWISGLIDHKIIILFQSLYFNNDFYFAIFISEFQSW